MEITYEKIKHLIVKEEVEGSMIKVSFKAANQDVPIDTVAAVAPDQSKIMKSVGKSAVKSSVTSGGISWLGRIFGGLIGGTGGSIARSAANSAGSAVASNQMQNDMNKAMSDFSDADKQTAIAKAFEPYLTMYDWNEDQQCFLAKN